MVPEPPPLRNITERDAEADFLAFQASDPKNRELVALVTHDILNILEDGYIENRMLCWTIPAFWAAVLKKYVRSNLMTTLLWRI